jgi:UDP-N-acetylglucosamine transferase subunit ALG13
MIFVTVGTTYGFDNLVQEIDRIAPDLNEKVILQLGNTKYKPKNCKWFNFKPNLTPYYKKARLVIAHGGAGTNYELLSMGKKVISVENKNVNDAHQWDLLKRLSDEKYIIWCKDISKISDSIKKAEKFKFKKYKQPECSIHKKIIGYLG